MKRNDYGSYILSLDKNNNAFLLGDGYSEKGQFPFMDQLNLSNLNKNRLFESKLTTQKETLLDYDVSKDELLMRVESKSTYPNYFYKSLKSEKEPNNLRFSKTHLRVSRTYIKK